MTSYTKIKNLIVATLWIATSFLMIGGCITVGARPEIRPFTAPVVAQSQILMLHKDFKKVVTASPEWVTLALRIINKLESETLARINTKGN